jgi:hypothetical protein
MAHAYFPLNSVVSLLATAGPGTSLVEVGVVGHEGLVGTSVALGVDVSPVRMTVQGSGAAMRATLSDFRAGLAASRSWTALASRTPHAPATGS